MATLTCFVRKESIESEKRSGSCHAVFACSGFLNSVFIRSSVLFCSRQSPYCYLVFVEGIWNRQIILCNSSHWSVFRYSSVLISLHTFSLIGNSVLCIFRFEFYCRRLINNFLLSFCVSDFILYASVCVFYLYLYIFHEVYQLVGWNSFKGSTRSLLPWCSFT